MFEPGLSVSGGEMKDNNWVMITGEDAHAIEVLNYSNQVNVIEALVRLLMHHYKDADGSCMSCPSIKVLNEFHRTATLFLLNNPGDFRDVNVHVVDGNGGVRYQPPPHEEVSGHIIAFFESLEKKWKLCSAQEIGAFSLWMINWIHPFRNGNGRTARAFCYACLCLKYGFVLPGNKTVIDLMMEQREEYCSALNAADIAYAEAGTPNLEPMIIFLDRLIFEQISSAPGIQD